LRPIDILTLGVYKIMLHKFSDHEHKSSLLYYNVPTTLQLYAGTMCV